MDLAGGVWMVFVTWPWLGCIDFDMGYDSAEYKAQDYMYVCLVSMITEVVLMHSDLWNVEWPQELVLDVNSYV